MRNRLGLLLSGTLVLASALLVGCEPPKPAEPAPPAEATGAPQPGSTAQGGGGVAPIGSGAAGGMTPMTGTENIQGGGSGVGQAAKDQARRAAGMAGGGSINTESTE